MKTRKTKSNATKAQELVTKTLNSLAKGDAEIKAYLTNPTRKNVITLPVVIDEKDLQSVLDLNIVKKWTSIASEVSKTFTIEKNIIKF